MAKMTVAIDDDLEDRFREAIFHDRGMRKGNIQTAIEEAIELWIKEKQHNERGRK